jgi:DNA polymerase III delta prime subunit
MERFITADKEFLKDLEQRAKGVCIRFCSEQMPTGCEPPTADVGFEIDAETGRCLLHVSRGLHCSGCPGDIRAWLETGTKQFETFGEFSNWISTELAGAYNAATTEIPQPTAPDECKQHSGALTDFESIEHAVGTMDNTPYLDEDDLLLSLLEKVHGQVDALRAMVAAIARHCARRNPRGPAVLFAVGPTGTGKTRAALCLAQALKNREKDAAYGFLRLDMSEYQEEHRVSQLIGSPQGYVGHGEGSQLVDALQANPRVIVLFDEIEKAHPAILRVLMNAMDAGRLSTSHRTSNGHEVDCRHAVFIFTSNLRSKEIIDELEAHNSSADRTVIDEVCRKQFQAAGILPEIVGRIGSFLVFHPLTPKVMARITVTAVVEVAEEYGIEVAYVEPQVVVGLLKNNRTQNLGARPGRNMVDDLLGGEFAKAAIRGVDYPVSIEGSPPQCVRYESGKVPS